MNMRDDWAQLDDVLIDAQRAAQGFLKSVAQRPVGHVLPALEPDILPDEGLGARGALAAFRGKYEAWLAASSGPRYLGFVTGGTTPAALAGDWLVAAYDQNVGSAGDSIATTVEHETLGLLRSLFGLPETFEGAFVTGATMANFVALATARQWPRNAWVSTFLSRDSGGCRLYRFWADHLMPVCSKRWRCWEWGGR